VEGPVPWHMPKSGPAEGYAVHGFKNMNLYILYMAYFILLY